MSGIYSVVSVIVGVSAVISFGYGLWVLDNESCQSEMRKYVLASTIMFPTYLALSVLFSIANVYSKRIPTAIMGVVKFLFDFSLSLGHLLRLPFLRGEPTYYLQIYNVLTRLFLVQRYFTLLSGG